MRKIFVFFGIENTNLKEILAHSISTFAFKIVGLMLAYLSMLLITQTFGAEVFGRYTLTLTLSQFFVLIFTLGLPNAIVKLTSGDLNNQQGDYLRKAIGILFISGVIASILLFLIGGYLANRIFNDPLLMNYFKALSVFVLPMMFHELFVNYFRGKKDFKKYNLFTFVLPYLFFFVFFYLLTIQSLDELYTYISYAIGICLVIVLEIVLAAPQGIKSTYKISLKPLLKLSFPMMFSGTLLFLLTWTDLIMLGYFKTSEDVGIYNAAFKIASLGFLIIIAVNVVIAPKIVELYQSNQKENLKKTIHQATRLIAIFTIPIVTFIIIYRVEILGLFGTEFIIGANALMIISIGVLISALSGNIDQILNMTKHHVLMRNIVIFCFLMNLILNIIFIPIYGINGAAITSLITNLSLNGIAIYFIRRHLGFYTFI